MDNNNLTPEEMEELQQQAQEQSGPSLTDRVNQNIQDYKSLKHKFDRAKDIKSKIDASKLKNASDMNRAANTAASSAAKAGTAINGVGAAGTTGTATTGAATTGAATTGAATTGAATTGAATTGAATTGAATTGAAATGAAATGAAATGAAATGAAASTPVGWIVIGVVALIILIALFVLAFELGYNNVIGPLSSKYSVTPETLINDYDNIQKDEECDLENGICNIYETDLNEMDEIFNDERSLGFSERWQLLWHNATGTIWGDASEKLVARILQDKVDARLETMGKKDDKNALPIGAVISSYAYAYSSQYDTLENRDYKDVVEYEGETIVLEDEKRINPSNPMSMLASLINNNMLETSDLDDLLDNLIFHELYPTYTWEEVREPDCVEKGNGEKECTHYWGCKYTSQESFKVDYDKYYMYLRYGPYVSGSVTGAANTLWGKKVNSDIYKEYSSYDTAFGYEYFVNLRNAYNTSDEECKLKSVAESTIAELNSGSDGDNHVMTSGVTEAINFFKYRDVTDGESIINYNHEIFDDFSKYTKKATTTIDDDTIPFVKVNNKTPKGDLSLNYNNGEDNIYKYGWIYNRFPHYNDKFQVLENTEYEYEDIVTPKDIERYISDIDSRKDIYNQVLGYNYQELYGESGSPSFNSDGSEAFPLTKGTYYISSCTGGRTLEGKLGNHDGIDIPAMAGTPVHAWKGGTVVGTNNGCAPNNTSLNTGGCSSGYGNYVIIDHGNGVFTMYGHMTSGSLKVSKGDVVSAGQQIGAVGSSGMSTGNHLHFEIATGSSWNTAQKQDPYPTIREILKDENIPNECNEGTVLNIK